MPQHFPPRCMHMWRPFLAGEPQRPATCGGGVRGPARDRGHGAIRAADGAALADHDAGPASAPPSEMQPKFATWFKWAFMPVESFASFENL